MKILISDYQNSLEEDYTLTIKTLTDNLPSVEISIVPYEDTIHYWKKLESADGLITAFLNLDANFLKNGKKLKVISLSSVGYGNVDLEAAQKLKIGICHINEYCTREVAEHTIGLILALNKNMKHYIYDMEHDCQWKYHSIMPSHNLSTQTLSIFGFGKIGKLVAKMAHSFQMKILVVDPNLTHEDAITYKVNKVTAKEALEKGDIISNHMNLTNTNIDFFNEETFSAMKKFPLFLNIGRGKSVNESALIKALDQGLIRGAGLDVLKDENPNLSNHPLLNRRNVIITPHSAFYSKESIEKLETLSSLNLANYLMGNFDEVNKIVTKVK